MAVVVELLHLASLVSAFNVRAGWEPREEGSFTVSVNHLKAVCFSLHAGIGTETEESDCTFFGSSI